MLPITHTPSSTPDEGLVPAVRRSTRGAVPKKVFDPSNGTPKAKRKTRATSSKNIKSGPKPKSQAIKNKLKSVTRENLIDMEETDGGTVVTLQAGLFEIFKKVLLMFYSNPGTVLGGRAFKFGTPRENNVNLTTSLLVHSNDQVYTINLYHSQSRLLVNGRNHAQFQHDFNLFVAFIRSQQAVGGIPIDADVNEILRLHLEETLDESDSAPLCKSPSVKQTDTGTTNQLSGNPRLEGADRINDKEAQSAAAGHIELEQGNQSNSRKNNPHQSQQLAIQDINSKAENGLIIEDRANIIQNQSKVLSNTAKSFNTQVHIPDKKVILQANDEGLLVSQNAEPEQETEPGQAASEIQPTRAETLSKLQANQLNVTFPPSNVIEIDQVDKDSPHTNQQKAITDGSPGSKQDKHTGKQRNRGNPTKTEEQKPLDPADIRKRETSLRKKEEAMKQREKRMEQMEKELADAKAELIIQEARIKDLEASNRLLNQRLLAEKSSPAQYPATHIENQSTPVFDTNHTSGQSASQWQATSGNMQLMHQMEKMEIRMQYNQQLTDLRQSFMMDKLNSIQNFQPPVPSYSALQFPQVQPSNVHPWWGTPATTTPAFAMQQAMGFTIPTGARPMYPNASGYMHPSTNRYMPNPQMQQQEKSTPRVQPVNQSPQRQTQPSAAPQQQPQQPKAFTASPTRSQQPTSKINSGARPKTNQDSQNSATSSSTQQPEDSFLQAAGPTNHMTQNSNLSTSEHTTSRM